MSELKEQIESGKYKNGDKIPTETELEKIYGVSRITIRRTVEELCNLGYLEKKQGKGTFVKIAKIHRKIEMRKSQSFSKTCLNANISPQSHLLESKIIPATKDKTEFLRLEEGDSLIYIKRLRSADRIPVILEELYLPEKIFKNFDIYRLENGSLFEVLKEDFKLLEAPMGVSEIEAVNAGTELSHILMINTGDAILKMITCWSDMNGSPLYIGYENIVGSRYRITI
jgi:hypothetical protein